MSNSNNQLAKKEQQSDLRAVLSGPQMKQRFADVLPKHLSPERYVRVALAAVSRAPKLLECTQESLMRCLIDLSAFGLEPDGRRAHLIPYGNQCTLIIDWKGLAELAMRSGVIAKLHADIVCENDEFDYDLGEVRRHKVDFKKPRGPMYAAYAMAQTKDGPVFVAVLTKEEIDGIRKRSKAGSSGPWVSDYNEMAKKTAFRRLAKWLPLSAEFRDAQERDEEEFHERDVTPPSAAASKLFQDAPTPALPAESAPVESTPLPDHVRALMQRDGIGWGQVCEFMTSNGVTVECPDVEDATDDQLAEIVNSWITIVQNVKGGSKA